MQVQFTKYANRALNNIYEWHKEKGYRKTGRKIRAAVITKVMLLKDQPLLGQEEENLKELELGHRYLVEGNYKIIYFIVEDLVVVSDIFDTRHDPEKMRG